MLPTTTPQHFVLKLPFVPKVQPVYRIRRLQSMSSRRYGWRPNLGKAGAKPTQDIESQDAESAPELEGRAAALPIAFLQGPIVLLTVALLWGTYGPTLRVLYELPGPPNPATLTAARSVIQATTLYGTSLWLGSGKESNGKDKSEKAGPTPLKAGLEMGFWNFLATSFQAVGLEHTSAIRSGFIIQVTSILTPVLATLSGESPTQNMWIGCFVALVSTVLITIDAQPSGFASGMLLTVSSGDAAVFAAAFFYSVTTVRLGFYAQRLPAITVASAKSNALTGFALLWLATLALQHGLHGGSVSDFWEGVGQPKAWILVLWAALGPGALAAFLQTQGQSKVPSSQAQIFYSSTPIWSAIIAMLVLREEGMGSLGWLGGFGILAAGLVAGR